MHRRAGDQPRASPWQSPPALPASFPQKLTLPEPLLDIPPVRHRRPTPPNWRGNCRAHAYLNNLQLPQAQGQFFSHLLGGLTLNKFALAFKAWDVEFRDLG